MTTVIVFIIVLILAGIVFFFHHQNKLKLRARLMREAVRNHEFTFHLPVKGLFYGEKALQEALNDLDKTSISWWHRRKWSHGKSLRVCLPMK